MSAEDIIDRLLAAERHYNPDVSSYDDLMSLLAACRGEIIELRIAARRENAVGQRITAADYLAPDFDRDLRQHIRATALTAGIDINQVEEVEIARNGGMRFHMVRAVRDDAGMFSLARWVTTFIPTPPPGDAS